MVDLYYTARPWICCLTLLWTTSICGQVDMKALPMLPEAVSNNAVTSARVGGDIYLYSFAGIDQTLSFNGIHKKAFRMKYPDGPWEAIAALPNGNGRIAAGASTVQNKIYIIGGYEVFSNGNERSFSSVHIYDPETNSYLADGADIPVPIDDHVQAVWRDSLIYIVTGWSNSDNVRNVQIYDPANDVWTMGTPVPNSTQYKVFGGSGVILNDTLYYLGGARFGPDFPPTMAFRKGYIHPNDPLQIDWSVTTPGHAMAYRTAAVVGRENPTWIGGSTTTYNFDALAYNGSGLVEPSGRIVIYQPLIDDLSIWATDFPLMDLRSAAVIDEGRAVVVGGIENDGVVSRQVIELTFPLILDTDETARPLFSIAPNPASQYLTIEAQGHFTVRFWSIDGQLQYHSHMKNHLEVPTADWLPGVYMLAVEDSRGKLMYAQKTWIRHD